MTNRVTNRLSQTEVNRLIAAAKSDDVKLGNIGNRKFSDYIIATLVYLTTLMLIILSGASGFFIGRWFFQSEESRRFYKFNGKYSWSYIKKIQNDPEYRMMTIDIYPATKDLLKFISGNMDFIDTQKNYAGNPLFTKEKIKKRFIENKMFNMIRRAMENKPSKISNREATLEFRKLINQYKQKIDAVEWQKILDGGGSLR